MINALSAGTDVLVFGNNLQYQPDIAKQVQQIILTAIKDGELSQKQIEKSFKKIQKVKKRWARL